MDPTDLNQIPRLTSLNSSLSSLKPSVPQSKVAALLTGLFPITKEFKFEHLLIAVSKTATSHHVTPKTSVSEQV